MDECAKKLWRTGSIKELGFRHRRNETMVRYNSTLAGSEFDSVGATTEKVPVPPFVFTGGL